MLLQYSVFNKGLEVQTELPLMVWFFKIFKIAKWHDEWVHDSQSNSNDDLWRFWLSQWLLRLQDISICSTSIQGAGHIGRAKWYVLEPGWRRHIRTDAKRKAVDFSTLQCVAGVILVNLVPGQNASFMLWSCWTRVKNVKPYFLRPAKGMRLLTVHSCYFLTLLACLFFIKLVLRLDLVCYSCLKIVLKLCCPPRGNSISYLLILHFTLLTTTKLKKTCPQDRGMEEHNKYHLLSICYIVTIKSIFNSHLLPTLRLFLVKLTTND